MKYNWAIVGHEKQLEGIERDFSTGNLAHAYLLAGSNGIGKYTVAKKMAGIFQCENDFCHTCNACLQVLKGSHIDTFEIVDDGESIKIEEVRKLVERLNMTRQSKYKVVLIQSLERMTTEAANSFLKILEEPPEKTVFVMTTNNIKLLLPTVLSRVRMVKFGSLPHESLKEKLRVLYPDFDSELLQMVSLFSFGKPGKAVHLIENPDALAEHLKVYNEVQGILKNRNIVDRFSYVESVSADEHQMETFFSLLSSVLRSKLLEGNSDNKACINALLKVAEAGMLLKRNINSKLVLENLMLSI